MSRGRRGGRRVALLRRLRYAAAAALILLLMLRLTGLAERLFYYPTRSTGPAPPGVEEVTFDSDGRTLHGWFFPAFYPRKDAAPAAPRPCVVHCHGNAQNISGHAGFVDFLPASGVHVLIFDYRSYGKSDRGPLRRDGLIADAHAAIEHARSRPDVDADRIGLYGLSLGGNIALAAAAEDPRVRAVCTVATFSTWKGVASDFTGPLGPFLVPAGRDAVDSAARLGDRPYLMLHGTTDGIVSYRHAGLIERAALDAGVDVELNSFPGADHVTWVETHPAMAERIVDFFRETLR